MLSYDAILVFAALAFIIVVLYLELLGPAFTFVIAVVFLGVFGVLTPREIIKGFANEQIAVVIMLLVIGDLIRRTGVVEIIFDRIFRSARSYKGFLGRMTILIATFSAFLNNTPLVVLMMPYVNSWCRRNNISPSKFLIPLSYASILGGSITLIGTSTNLIVNGMVVDQTILGRQLEPLQIFDFAYVGIPMMIIGVLYLVFFSDKLLPSRVNPLTNHNTYEREYFIEARVKDNSKLIGQTIAQAHLNNIQGFTLLDIIRKSVKISVVAPDRVLQQGDVIVFTGDTTHIADLIKSNKGLSFQEVGMLRNLRRTEIIEVVVSQNSDIIDKTIRDINFRSNYDSAIIAVHRNGERISGKIADEQLKAGDVLLLFAGTNFLERSRDSKDFYFLTKVQDFVRFENYKLVILLGGTVLSILLSAFNLVPLFTGLIVIIMVSLILRITTPKDLPKSIDYNLAIIIVLSLALGEAMQKTGAADLIANSLISVFYPLGKMGILFGIYIITSILAAYITTKASVAILFPIALTASYNLGTDPMPFILVVAYAAAANFITPIGFQTNLMVYGPGHYSFKDYFKIGAPLTLIYMVVSVLILSWLYFPEYALW